MSALPIIKETLTSPNNIYLKHVCETFSGKHFTLQDLQTLLKNPDKEKKETTIDERSTMEYNPLQCNIRVWNQGLGAQCNCQKLENETISIDGVNGSEIVLGSLNEVSTNGNWPKVFDAKRE